MIDVRKLLNQRVRVDCIPVFQTAHRIAVPAPNVRLKLYPPGRQVQPPRRALMRGTTPAAPPSAATTTASRRIGEQYLRAGQPNRRAYVARTPRVNESTRPDCDFPSR